MPHSVLFPSVQTSFSIDSNLYFYATKNALKALKMLYLELQTSTSRTILFALGQSLTFWKNIPLLLLDDTINVIRR